MAFFRITFPSPLMNQPAQADLIVIDINTGSSLVVASFPPGNYPLGVSWGSNDEILYFSAGTQVSQGGQFPPIAIARTAEIFAVSPNGGAVGQIPSARNGYFPNAVVSRSPRIFLDGFE